MFDDTYKTLAAPSEGLYKEKGSKFLAFAYPVHTIDEVKAHLEQLRKDYFDARHHCYAYILGPRKDAFRTNDDGEPSGLANAYKTAARDAIDHAAIVEKTIDCRYRFSFAYETMNDVMRILKEFDLKPENPNYALDCTLEVSVRQSQSVRLYDRVADLRTVKIDVL